MKEGVANMVKQFVYRKWPDKVFPMVNFFFPRWYLWPGGGGWVGTRHGGGGGLLVRLSAVPIHCWRGGSPEKHQTTGDRSAAPGEFPKVRGSGTCDTRHQEAPPTGLRAKPPWRFQRQTAWICCKPPMGKIWCPGTSRSLANGVCIGMIHERMPHHWTAEFIFLFEWWLRGGEH